MCTLAGCMSALCALTVAARSSRARGRRRSSRVTTRDFTLTALLGKTTFNLLSQARIATSGSSKGLAAMMTPMRSARYLAVLMLSPALYGSKEGVLSLDTLHMESRGLGSSGPVVIDGTQSDDGMQSLQVRAFGKLFVLSASELKAL